MLCYAMLHDAALCPMQCYGVICCLLVLSQLRKAPTQLRTQSQPHFTVHSFLANFELPYLRKDEVSKVQIWVMDDIEGPDV